MHLDGRSDDLGAQLIRFQKPRMHRRFVTETNDENKEKNSSFPSFPSVK
jgi:hypothetical protein